MKWLPGVAVLLAAAPAQADKADAKHSVAVLSMVPKDTALVRTAAAVSATIRTQAGAKASEYRIVGTAKQIDTAMLASECSAIQPVCAAKLGAALDADYAIAGELERRGTHQILVLVLVDVKTKHRIRSVRQTAGSNGDAKKLARAAYTRLVGGDVGELALVANVPQGEVLVDGEIMAGLFEGRATIDGLLKGSHLVVVRAKGYKPVEVDVTVEAETKQMVLLEPE